MGPDLIELHSRDRQGRPWSDEDELTLRTMAGKVPAEQISGTLSRSLKAVTRKAEKMGLDLWCPPSGLVRCPECGEWRTHLVDGVCGLCHREATVAALRRREAELEELVGPEYLERSRMMLSEPSRHVPAPKRSEGMRGVVEYERRRRKELAREKHRLRRRCERMEAWIRRHYGDNV